MNRSRVLAVALVAVLSSAGLAVAAGVGQRPTPVERVHRYYPGGPSAEYSGDSGALAEVAPLRFRVPDDSPTTGVAEASFGYRTRGPGPFTVSLGVRGADGRRVTVRPARLRLAPAPDGAATTVRFLVPDLERGTGYEAQLGVNATFVEQGRNVVSTRSVVLTVDLS